MSKPTKKPARILSPIRSDELYSLAVVRRLTGWGDAAIRAARKNGLRMLYLHKRVFCRGADLLRYIEANGTEEP
jgi:hypothetical protein